MIDDWWIMLAIVRHSNLSTDLHEIKQRKKIKIKKLYRIIQIIINIKVFYRYYYVT